MSVENTAPTDEGKKRDASNEEVDPVRGKKLNLSLPIKEERLGGACRKRNLGGKFFTQKK